MNGIVDIDALFGAPEEAPHVVQIARVLAKEALHNHDVLPTGVDTAVEHTEVQIRREPQKPSVPSLDGQMHQEGAY